MCKGALRSFSIWFELVELGEKIDSRAVSLKRRQFYVGAKVPVSPQSNLHGRRKTFIRAQSPYYFEQINKKSDSKVKKVV